MKSKHTAPLSIPRSINPYEGWFSPEEIDKLKRDFTVDHPDVDHWLADEVDWPVDFDGGTPATIGPLWQDLALTLIAIGGWSKPNLGGCGTGQTMRALQYIAWVDAAEVITKIKIRRSITPGVKFIYERLIEIGVLVPSSPERAGLTVVRDDDEVEGK